MAPVPGELPSGTCVGPCRVERVIAQGRHGVTYRATLNAHGWPVALKVIRPEVAADGDYTPRFLDVWRRAGSLDHPSAIAVYDAGCDDEGRLYVAARWVDGDGLAGLEPWLLRPLLEQVGGCLDAAVAAGLVHSGLAADDILVVRHGGEPNAVLTGAG